MSVQGRVVYLVRHSKAVGAHPDGDRFRALSAEGRQRVEQVLPHAREHGFGADLALSSPYLRALQTRELFQPLLGSARQEISTAFTPDGDLGEAIVELRAWSEAGFARLAVFTHNPFVTELADLLLEPRSLSDLVFHTPTILALEFAGPIAPRNGRPLWILHP